MCVPVDLLKDRVQACPGCLPRPSERFAGADGGVQGVVPED